MQDRQPCADEGKPDMGFVNKVFRRPKTKPQPVQQPVVRPATTSAKTASEIAAEEDKRKKQAAIVANAGPNRRTTVGGGNADITSKTLLGL